MKVSSKSSGVRIPEIEEAPDVGAKSARWSKEEDDIVRKYWVAKGAKPIAKYLNRTTVAVDTRAWRLGLSRKCKPKDPRFD